MLQKSTKVFATHDSLDLECDIYTQDDYPNDTPVFLYFHPGGLVWGGRDSVPPWLVQACMRRKWPLISASYRLLPQVGAQGLLKDAIAAHEFARAFEAPKGSSRRVIACGGSAPFFLAVLLAHHHPDPPIALLSICGAPTFRHPFFNSSTMLTPEPIPHSDMEPFTTGSPVVGTNPVGDTSVFFVDMLRSDGSKNPDYKAPPKSTATEDQDGEHFRGELYDYYLYNNKYLELVGEVDPGFDWAKDPKNAQRLGKWPVTSIFHGDDDYDVPIDVSKDMESSLGKEKVKLTVVEGGAHLFEARKFVEDEGSEMEAVKKAFKVLEDVVG